MEPSEYEKIYQHVHRKSHLYRFQMSWGSYIIPLICRRWVNRPGTVIVDVGCGNHTFLNHIGFVNPGLIMYGIDIVRVEPIPQEVTFLKAPAWNLRGVGVPIDLITSFDLLEHLAPDDVYQTLEEWSGRAKRLVVSISSVKSITLGPEGQNLHLTIQPLDWWKEKMKLYFQEVSIIGKTRFLTATM